MGRKESSEDNECLMKMLPRMNHLHFQKKCGEGMYFMLQLTGWYSTGSQKSLHGKQKGS